MNFTLAEARRNGDENFQFDIEILQAFLGLCIARGAYKRRDEPLKSLWSSRDGRPLFVGTMSRDTFLLILRYIRFDDKEKRRRGEHQDKFQHIRQIWETTVENFRKCYFRQENATIDEQLFPCRARCPFIQYMPQKPAKFGIKFWLMCDAGNFYVLNAAPYIGREGSRERNLAQHVVEKLSAPFQGSGINITVDNFFTSYQLARSMREKGFSIVGTLRANRREIPPSVMNECKEAELYNTSFLYSDEATLAVYKAKRNKCVALLSSKHRAGVVGNVATNPKLKPEICLFYNQTKGGVDSTDQMVRYYSSKVQTRRWPLACFFNLLDMICLNAFVISKSLGIFSGPRREFLIQLAEVLCKPHMLLRQPKQPRIKEIISGYHPEELQAHESRRTTCRSCHKNKTKSVCVCCKQFTCGSCSTNVCKTCAM